MSFSLEADLVFAHPAQISGDKNSEIVSDAPAEPVTSDENLSSVATETKTVTSEDERSSVATENKTVTSDDEQSAVVTETVVSGENSSSANTTRKSGHNVLNPNGIQPVKAATRVKGSSGVKKQKPPTSFNDLENVKTDELIVDRLKTIWDPRVASVLTTVKARQIHIHVEINAKDPFTLGTEALKLRTLFTENELYNLNTKMIIRKDPISGYLQTDTIPFHIMTTLCLLAGKNPNRGYFNNLYKLWKGIVADCIKMCNSNEVVAKSVLDHIMVAHVNKAYAQYALFVNTSDDPGMCAKKLECVTRWISKLKEDAENYYELYKAKERVRLLQDIVYEMSTTEKDVADDDTKECAWVD